MRVDSGSEFKTSRNRGCCAVGSGIEGSPASSRLFAFAGRRCIAAATAAQALAKSLALFRRHLLPALEVLAATLAAITAVPAKAAEENPAKHQQSQSLPEADRTPSEQRRQQPIPKMHDQFAKERHTQR